MLVKIGGIDPNMAHYHTQKRVTTVKHYYASQKNGFEAASKLAMEFNMRRMQIRNINILKQIEKYMNLPVRSVWAALSFDDLIDSNFRCLCEFAKLLGA